MAVAAVLLRLSGGGHVDTGAVTAAVTNGAAPGLRAAPPSVLQARHLLPARSLHMTARLSVAALVFCVLRVWPDAGMHGASPLEPRGGLWTLLLMTRARFLVAAICVAAAASLAVRRASRARLRREERTLSSVGRKRVQRMQKRLARLDGASPDALLAAAAEDVQAALPRGCAVALVECAVVEVGDDGADGAASAAAHQLRVLRVQCAAPESYPPAALAALAAAARAGCAPRGSAAVALAHPLTCTGFTLDAEDDDAGSAAYPDWAALCAPGGAGAGGVSVTLIGSGLRVCGSMLVHVPHGRAQPPAPTLLRKFAEGVGAALLRVEAARTAAAITDAAARAEADAMMALQHSFLSGVTHELKTPLNAVIGFNATVLEETAALEPHLRVHLRDALFSSTALLNLVDQLLLYARFEAGGGSTPLLRAPLSFATLLAELEVAMGAKASAGGVALTVELDELITRGGRRLTGDPSRVAQLLRNLTDNAIKVRLDASTLRGACVCAMLLTQCLSTQFTPSGGRVRVSVAACDDAPPACDSRDDQQPRMSSSTASRLQHVRITVTDTGRGVAEADRGRLFHPFSQVFTSAQGKPDGAGLGLVIARALARQMGGDVAFSPSEEGKGSTFSALLPFEVDESPASATASSTTVTASATTLSRAASAEMLSQLASAPPLSASVAPQRSLSATAAPLPYRVLVAEDNPMNAKVAMAVLRRCGVPCPALACDGVEALAAAQATDFDFILMDCRMPRCDGPAATRAIRLHEGSPEGRGRRRAWIVACTANTAPEDRAECMAAGMDDFLSKPIHPEAMRATLARFAAARGAALADLDKPVA